MELARPGVGSGPLGALDPLGNAVVVWSHDIGEPRVLQASYRRGRAGPWDFPIDISDERFREGTQRVGMDPAGNVVAAWARSGASGLVVQAAVRSAESGIWGPPVEVSPQDGAVGAPRLAVGAGGDAVVAWATTDGRVVASRRSAGGGWVPLVAFSTSGANALSDVDVAVNAAGDIGVAWSAVRSSGAVVQAAFQPAGGSWSSTVLADTSRAESRTPRVALDPSGNAHVLFLGFADRSLVHASTRNRATGAWSAPVRVSPPESDTTDLQLAVDAAGNAVAAWTDGDGRTLAALRPSAGSWQPAAALSGIPTGRVRLAMGPVGAALAVWSRFEPRRVRVEASELGGGGPVLGSLAVPAAGTAGVPVELGVEPFAWAAPLRGESAWVFGDGGTATGARVRHVFARPGRYTVSVSQADVTGATTTATATVTIAARAPANTARPSIRGRPRVGATLTCHRGSWSGTAPIRFAYRWLRNGRAVASGGRFRVRPRDRGSVIRCRVTASNAAGEGSRLSTPLRIR